MSIGFGIRRQSKLRALHPALPDCMTDFRVTCFDISSFSELEVIL